MKVDLLIKNGNVVFPKEGVRKVNIGVVGEKIVGMFDPEMKVEANETLDVTGLYVMPGVIDAHQHLGIYNSVEEDFRDTKQHAVGGITTVVNYDRQPVSYLEFFPKVRQIGEENSYIDFSYSLGILTEQHIDELEEVVKTFGLTSFKFFRNYERRLNDIFKIDNGINLSSMDLMRILEKMKEISPKLILGVHCENMDINRALTAELMQQDVDDTLATWSKTSPGYAEAESLLSTLYLNHIVGGNIFAVHISSGASVDVLEKVPWLLETGVTIETCPHYLTLTEESETGLHAKVGPPIHSKWDQDRLWEGIEKGLINAIGTDHVPNSRNVKFATGEGVWDAKFGFPGAGALLPLMITEGHKKRGIPLERIAQITSYQIAKAFNLEEKGKIEVGADADFAIVDLETTKTITPELMHAQSDYSVYEGMETVGWPVYTINRGEIIVKDGQPTKELGRGKYIRRSI